MKPKIYFTADWHVAHDNCLKFDNRPFKDINHMHETLVNNFNYYVPEHGITYFLGDMGFRGRGVLMGLIERLNGTKVLVRGNHDGNVYSMYNAGFDVVLDKAQIMIGKNIVTMSHCPLQGVFREDTSLFKGHDGTENWHGEKRQKCIWGQKDIYSWNDFGQYHLHAHIHSGPHNNKPKIDGRQMDVGVVAWNYKVVTISDVESWIALDQKYPHT